MKYVYIHGFNSAANPQSDKIQQLSKLGDVITVTYDTFAPYDVIELELSAQVPSDEDVTFVGTSLGGFWAFQMGRKFAAPSVIINPAINPALSLCKYIGIEQMNHVTGEVKTLSDWVVETYIDKALDDKDKSLAFLPLLLLDLGDDVLNPFTTRDTLTMCPMFTWNGGSHRFDHMEQALDKINNYVNHCSYVSVLD